MFYFSSDCALFEQEVREDPIVITKLNSKQLIWDEMYPVIVDTQRLEHLFESRAKDLITKVSNPCRTFEYLRISVRS